MVIFWLVEKSLCGRTSSYCSGHSRCKQNINNLISCPILSYFLRLYQHVYSWPDLGRHYCKAPHSFMAARILDPNGTCRSVPLDACCLIDFLIWAQGCEINSRVGMHGWAQYRYHPNGGDLVRANLKAFVYYYLRCKAPARPFEMHPEPWRMV